MWTLVETISEEILNLLGEYDMITVTYRLKLIGKILMKKANVTFKSRTSNFNTC
jgi:hypothetical protein